MRVDSLSSLRISLFHALGLSACVVGCTDRPLDPAGTSDASTTAASSSTTTVNAATTASATTTVSATTTASPTTTAGISSTTLVDSATTDAPGSTTGTIGTTGTTDPVDPSTTTTGGTTGAPDVPCTPLSELGLELMPADVITFPGCEDHEASECYNYALICAPLADGLDSCDACAPNCLGDLPELCGEITIRQLACGPFTQDRECCHVVEYGWICGDGRPFLVEGTARVADPIAGGAWTDALAELDDAPIAALDLEARAELAALWTADALAEHASIASFARFTLQLLALAAPPELVDAACAAQADEVSHARLAFALASRYGGAPVGPGPLDLTGALAGGSGWVDVIIAVVREGCVGETIAAAELDMAARTCVDPALARLLRRLAADEQRHAALAWRTLQWALGRGDPELRHAVAAALTLELSPPPADRLDGAVLRRHGRLPARERAALAAACMRSVVLPCVQALLAGAGEPRTASRPASASLYG